MPRLGDFDVPEVSLSESIALLRRVHSAMGADASRAGVAGLLRLNPRGGWFASVLSALRLWGLVDGRGTVRMTSLGIRLATAPDGAARAQASLSWPLLAALTRRIPGDLPGRSDLALVLFEVTNAGAGRIHASLVQVRRMLEDAWPERPPATQADDTPGPTAPATGGMAGVRSVEAGGRIELGFSGGHISLPETPENLELVVGLLRRRLTELGGEEGVTP